MKRLRHLMDKKPKRAELLIDLPQNVMEQLLEKLSITDLFNLRLVCHKLCSSIPWRLWFLKANPGKNGLDSHCKTLGADPYLRAYLSFLRNCNQYVSVVDARVVNEQYYERCPPEKNSCGPILRLESVCWLEVLNQFCVTTRGVYRLSYRVRKYSRPMHINGVETRIKASKNDVNYAAERFGINTLLGETDLAPSWDELALNKWAMTNFVEFTVDEPCVINSRFWNVDNPYWKTGIDFDVICLELISSPTINPNHLQLFRNGPDNKKFPIRTIRQEFYKRG